MLLVTLKYNLSILPPTLVVNKLQFATEAQVQVKHVGMAVSVQLTGQIIAYCSDLVCWTLKNYITFAQFFPETLAGVSSLSFPPKDNTYWISVTSTSCHHQCISIAPPAQLNASLRMTHHGKTWSFAKPSRLVRDNVLSGGHYPKINPNGANSTPTRSGGGVVSSWRDLFLDNDRK